jgi:curli biogenesis system outer membrane secretion channel CsgG
MTSCSRVSTVLLAIVVALLSSACAAGSSTTSRSSPVPAAQTYAFDFPLLDAPAKP